MDDATELGVLRDLYAQAGGAQWDELYRSAWAAVPATLADAGAQLPGVTVADGDVIGLSLPGQPMRAAWSDVAATLAPLRGLRGLYLPSCQLSGPLDADFAAWPRLQALHLYNNALTGPIPPGVPALPALNTLALANNRLDGPIPALWRNARGFGALDLGNNQFTGPVPDQLGRMTNLRGLGLYQNQLTGRLPDSLARCTQLQDLAVHNNRFTGPLPAGWGALTQLVALNLGSNQLEGPLPDAWSGMRALVYLHAPANRLRGPLPAAWGQLTALNQLVLSRNQLSGALPASWGNMAQLYLLDLDHNQLTGPLPALPQRLYRLNVAVNRLSGRIPEGLRGSFLNLDHNRFSGRLPASYGAATQQDFYQITLDHNELTGIPAFAHYSQQQFGLTGNYLQFDSYEANLAVPGQYQHFDYGQRTPGPADTVRAVPGTRTTLPPLVNGVRPVFGGAHNHYQWQRRVGHAWVDMSPSDTLAVLDVTASTGTEGEYRIRVTNRWLPWMMLYTRSSYVDVLPVLPLTYNDPVELRAASGLVSSYPLPLPPTSRGAAATDSVNYVRTYVARAPFTDPDQLRAAGKEQVQVSTQYLDGLGRPVQTVQRQASPAGADVVQPVAYDALGRQPKQYLPYAADTARRAPQDGRYRPDALFEQDYFHRVRAAGLGLPATPTAYAETHFEASPLNRVLAQGSPGEAWQLAAGHAVWTDERPNRARDAVRRWAPGYDQDHEDLTPQGTYAPGSLWVKLVHNEQHQLARTFTDPEGHVVLKQVASRVGAADTTWLDTYYVYDDFGLLRAVLPPLAVQRIRAHQWAVDGAGVERLLFRYRYDAQGRLIEKKVPDQDHYSLTVYDALDRPILTQDPAQRATNEWVNTRYDALGRVVYTARVRRPGVSRQDLQAAADAHPQHWEEPRSTPALPRAYYSGQAYPPLQAGDELLAVTYYDQYDHNQNGPADDPAYQRPTAAELAGAEPAATTRTTGLTTRTEVRVLGADEQWLTTTTFYDEELRPLQVQATNVLGQQDVTTTRYDFAGQAVAAFTRHRGVQGQGPNRTPLEVAVRTRTVYDHGGRVLESYQQLDNQAEERLALQQYNEQGQLAQKRLGADLQVLDYRYNVRGWLAQLNDPDRPAVGPRADLFSLRLDYEGGVADGRDQQYGGNIAAQRWRVASDNVEHFYGYRYDSLNRLVQGDYLARSASGTWGVDRGAYRFYGVRYDANGNLLALRRRGLVQEALRTAPRRYDLTDNLRYAYAAAPSNPTAGSNRLLRVDDLAPDANYFGPAQPQRPDFQDGATLGSQADDYAYDAAGSLVSDRNKGIERIRYNFLHLPQSIRWSNGDSLQFYYTAAGQKVAKVAYDHARAATAPPVVTTYVGPWQYEGDSLRWLSHADGRVLRFVQRDLALQPHTRYATEYTIKDHLGNLRVAFRPGDRNAYTATLEAAAHERETQQFDASTVSDSVRANVGPQFGHRNSSWVLRLNAAKGRPLGALKTLAVRKGDIVDGTAFGAYWQPVQQSNWWYSLAAFVASSLQPAPQQNVQDGPGRPRVLPLLRVGLSAAQPLQPRPGGVPTAYLRILVFDRDSNLVANKVQRLSADANAGNYSNPLAGYEQLHDSVLVKQDGVVQVYVSNESDTEVYFDDITVEHRQGLRVQEIQYDPYGLELAGLNRAAATQNNYTWNGKERQDEFGLRWLDHGWRFYDPSLGRWVVTDPDAEEGDQESWGTYQFGLDNAVRYNDLDGRKALTHYFDSNGQFLGDDKKGNDVRIVDKDTFNKVTENGNKIIENSSELKKVENSKPASDSNLSTQAVVNIFEHYNDTGIKLTPGVVKGELLYSATSANKKVTSEKITLNTSRVVNEKIINNYKEIKSTISHEKKHLLDFRIDPILHNKKSDKEKEASAVKYQMEQPEFKDTRPAFQEAVRQYGISNGMEIPKTL